MLLAEATPNDSRLAVEVLRFPSVLIFISVFILLTVTWQENFVGFLALKRQLADEIDDPVQRPCSLSRSPQRGQIGRHRLLTVLIAFGALELSGCRGA